MFDPQAAWRHPWVETVDLLRAAPGSSDPFAHFVLGEVAERTEQLGNARQGTTDVVDLTQGVGVVEDEGGEEPPLVVRVLANDRGRAVGDEHGREGRPLVRPFDPASRTALGGFVGGRDGRLVAATERPLQRVGLSRGFRGDPVVLSTHDASRGQGLGWRTSFHSKTVRISNQHMICV